MKTVNNIYFNHENTEIWMLNESSKYSEFTNFFQFLLENKIYENLYNSIIGNYFKILLKYVDNNNDETTFEKASEDFFKYGGSNPIAFLSKYVSKYLTKNVVSVIEDVDNKITLYVISGIQNYILSSNEYKENGLRHCLTKFGYSIVSTKIELNNFIKSELQKHIADCKPRFKSQLDKARKNNDANKFTLLKEIFEEVPENELEESVRMCDEHNSKIIAEFPQITLGKTGEQQNYYTVFLHSEGYDAKLNKNVIKTKFIQNASIFLLKAVSKLISHYPTYKISLSTDDYRIKSSTKINSQNNPTLTFGKYNGKDILSLWKIDKKYCLWLKSEFKKNKSLSTIQKKIHDIIYQLKQEDESNEGDYFEEGGSLSNIEFKCQYDKYFEYVPLSEIEKYIEFDREVDYQINKKHLDELTEEIKVNGINYPITLEVYIDKGLIVEGNHRIAVAKRLGIKYIPIRVVERSRPFKGNIYEHKVKELPSSSNYDRARIIYGVKILDSSNSASVYGFTKVDSYYKKGGEIEKVTFNNFHKGTKANFKEIMKEGVPKRKPDFISDSGSKYWFTANSVIRKSDHWGQLDTCQWNLDNKSGNKYTQGICKLIDFEN